MSVASGKSKLERGMGDWQLACDVQVELMSVNVYRMVYSLSDVVFTELWCRNCCVCAMQSGQVLCLRLVGPPHLASVQDPYLMKEAVLVGSVAEGCRLSCRRLKKALYFTDVKLSLHTPVCCTAPLSQCFLFVALFCILPEISQIFRVFQLNVVDDYDECRWDDVIVIVVQFLLCNLYFARKKTFIIISDILWNYLRRVI